VPQSSLESNSKAKSSRRPVITASTTPETQSATSDPQLVQRAADAPVSKLRSRDVLALQRTVGNRAVQRRLSTPKIQTKLTVGAANDSFEKEADQVAEQIATPAPVESQTPPPQPAVQRLAITASQPSLQRKGGASAHASEQWDSYKDDLSTSGEMIEEGFVSGPKKAYNTFAPSEDDKKKKGVGASIKRGGQHVLGGAAALVTGAVAGPLALGLAATNVAISTVGRGLSVAGRGMWSAIKSAAKSAKSGGKEAGAAAKDQYKLLAGKKGKGFDDEAAMGRTDTLISATSTINTTVSQGVSAATGATSSAAGVTSSVTGPIGVLVGFIKGSVSAARAHRAGKRQDKAEQTLKDSDKVEMAQKQYQEWFEKNKDAPAVQLVAARAERETDTEKFLGAVQFFGGKNKLKKWRSIMESGAAFTGAAGSAAITGGMIAGAVGLTALLASNPVGWGIALGLMGVGAIVGIGYTLYRLINAVKKGDKKGVDRQKYSNDLVTLAAKGHPYSIQFLKELGIIKTSADDKKGKFTLEEFTSNKAQVIAFLMNKMRSV
jgi:hypothetical protein